MKPLDRMCYSKRRFESEAAALEASKGATFAEIIHFRAYLCPNCHSYHLTKTERRESHG